MGFVCQQVIALIYRVVGVTYLMSYVEVSGEVWLKMMTKVVFRIDQLSLNP